MLAASDDRKRHDMIFSRRAKPGIVRFCSGFTFCKNKQHYDMPLRLVIRQRGSFMRNLKSQRER